MLGHTRYVKHSKQIKLQQLIYLARSLLVIRQYSESTADKGARMATKLCAEMNFAPLGACNIGAKNEHPPRQAQARPDR